MLRLETDGVIYRLADTGLYRWIWGQDLDTEQNNTDKQEQGCDLELSEFTKNWLKDRMFDNKSEDSRWKLIEKENSILGTPELVAWKLHVQCARMLSCSVVSDSFETPWTVAH